ncbi:MAG TPA: hypothetical protein PLM98_15960, partial [Thiolinea sp.]|nr:hypothetical protein [Thiolinea sp.]
PDFLWTPTKGTPAQTRYENAATGTWDDMRKAMPASWRAPAIQASANDHAPLAKIVERLISFSNGTVRAATAAAPTSAAPSGSTSSTPSGSTNTPNSTASPTSRIGTWFNRILGRDQ